MIITEDILRQIVRTALLEAIEEGGTNMQSLYHFTDLDKLVKILSDGYLNTNQWQDDRRNGKRFVSFTRHRSNLEGFAFPRNCNVRIEVDGQKLSSVHGNVYPYEYYSPGRRWSNINSDYRSAKKKYQDAHARGIHRSGEEAYMHQAEESFETKSPKLFICDVVKRIDILVPNNLLNAISNFNQEQKYEWVYKMRQLLFNSMGNTGLIFVYENQKDFNLQTDNCIILREYANKLVDRAYYNDTNTQQ